MSWWRRAERMHADRRSADLLDVWGEDEAPPGAAPAEMVPTLIVRRQPAPEVDADVGGAGGLVCVRVNCRQEGRATSAARCPACGHGTALLRDYRWPRTG